LIYHLWYINLPSTFFNGYKSNSDLHNIHLCKLVDYIFFFISQPVPEGIAASRVWGEFSQIPALGHVSLSSVIRSTKEIKEASRWRCEDALGWAPLHKLL